MRLPKSFIVWLGWHLWCVAQAREPDFIIGGADNPYLRRWFLTPWSGLYRDVAPGAKTLWQRIVTSLPCIYLHEFRRSDDDRALHDHPWANVSILLAGRYREHSIAAGGIHIRTIRETGDIVFRWARVAHRIELYRLTERGAREEYCWSLFLTGFRLRDWGFHCAERGWIPWRRFAASDDRGSIGKGCEG